ncbi:TetR-like C-terminal domain-containing protein [Streptomyces sp. NPDC048018]|uniref:TetR-like C-terminal domain-containing protein n=1 Tax=Streptomyces sp. NPDC048018 TaxID=3365499 RepID=UPI003718FC5B
MEGPVPAARLPPVLLRSPPQEQRRGEGRGEDDYRTRLTEWAPAVTRAAARGEVPAGTDPLELLRAVSAPLYYRFAISREELTEADAERAVTAALAAARAGAFTGSPGTE